MDISEITSIQFDPNFQIGKNSEEAKKIEAAKGFEAVLIQKLLDTVRESIGSLDMDEDGASEQMHGLFWMYLGQEISDQGGFGLWKDVYNSFNELYENNESETSTSDTII